MIYLIFIPDNYSRHISRKTTFHENTDHTLNIFLNIRIAENVSIR